MCLLLKEIQRDVSIHKTKTIATKRDTVYDLFHSSDNKLKFLSFNLVRAIQLISNTSGKTRNTSSLFIVLIYFENYSLTCCITFEVIT